MLDYREKNMLNYREIKMVNISYDPDHLEAQNLSLKKSNTILFGIIALAILVFIGVYIRTHEDENDR